MYRYKYMSQCLWAGENCKYGKDISLSLHAVLRVVIVGERKPRQKNTR